MASRQRSVARPKSEPSPAIRFLGRYVAVVLFMGLAFGGMMGVYWFFSPPAGATAEVFAAPGANDSLSAPITKLVPSRPVNQRFAQSPGPVLIGFITGHKDNDSGAVCDDGLTEAQVVENITRKIMAQLATAGVRSEMLAEFDSRLPNYQGTALISIHADSCQYVNEEATGFKLAGSSFTDSSHLSACVEQSYRQATGMSFHYNTVTPHMTDYHAFREIAPGVPAIIIEVGFLNLDRMMLTRDSDRPAAGIANGVLCFLGR